MNKLLPILILMCFNGFAQKRYVPVRAGVGVEAFGTAPVGQAYTEAFFGYKPRSFGNVQAGMGMIDGSDYLTFSFSGAITYSYLLNPYRRTACNPVPGYNRFETYLEGGVATFFCDTKYNNGNSYTPNSVKEPLLTPLGIAGVRTHIITNKLIYIVKVRYTPAFIESRNASQAGVALGFAWR